MPAEDMRPSPRQQDPLGFMTALSPWVRVYRPSKETKPENRQDTVEAPADDTTTGETTKESRPEDARLTPVGTTADAPALIAMFPWFSANPSIVAKKSPDVEPAISVIKDIASTISEEAETGKPRILVHSFSNAGSAMLSRVREAYGDPFPPHVTIFDSGPGLYNFNRCLNGATAGLPRWLWVITWPGSALITVSYASLYAGRRDAFWYWFEMHNEVGGEVRRTYIYSEADEIIATSHVERNAREAEDKGYNVRLEKFSGSAHVSHMRLDERRYWMIVNETWQGQRPISSRL